MAKRVRVTIELPESFVRLLAAKAHLAGWTGWATGANMPPEMDAGSILAWLVLMEARGATEGEIHAATPLMWRNGPRLVHEERRVLSDPPPRGATPAPAGDGVGCQPVEGRNMADDATRLFQFALDLGCTGGGAKKSVAIELLARLRNGRPDDQTAELADCLLADHDDLCDECLASLPCHCRNDD